MHSRHLPSTCNNPTHHAACTVAISLSENNPACTAALCTECSRCAAVPYSHTFWNLYVLQARFNLGPTLLTLISLHLQPFRTFTIFHFQCMHDEHCRPNSPRSQLAHPALVKRETRRKKRVKRPDRHMNSITMR